jgi:alkyl hydroperoxide reductase subunit F
MQYDLVIIGGGPAAVAAGVYASRKKLKSVLVATEIGGQSVVSEDIQNWIGTPSISGSDLVKSFKAHLDAYKGDVVDVQEGKTVTKVEKNGDTFTTTTDKGDSFESRAILICSGANRRRLSIPGADEFEHKGLTYCASCDGPLFTDMDVVVIGGGNAGFETAAQLLAYTKSVTLLHRGDQFKADPITVEKVLADPKMTAIKNANISEVLGDKFVTGLKYTIGDEEKELAAAGIFVEIGMIPSTDFAEGLVAMDEHKRILVDGKSQQTQTPGVWSAGDCTDELYHQNNIAAGDAVKALEDIYVHLKTK